MVRFFLTAGVLLLSFGDVSQAFDEIRKISVHPKKSICEVIVDTSRNVSHQVEFLESPPRLVVDFPNAQAKFTRRFFEMNENPLVSRIRLSENLQEGKKTLRMVVDLKAPFQFEKKISAEKLTFTILPKPREKPADIPPPPPSPKPAPAATGLPIGAEDLLEVTVFNLPQFNITQRVTDGTITMPLIGSIELLGLTKKEAEEKIAQAMQARYIAKASVSVQVKEFKSKQVSVLGAVKNPGPYSILGNRTLLQIISDAGGLTASASEKCFIFRNNSSRIEINLHELLNTGKEELNVLLQPGDIVNVQIQPKITVYVLGAVRNPGAVEINEPTLLGAIAQAGGLTEQASKSNIQIKRKEQTGADLIIKANLKDILAGKTPDLVLSAYDVVNVSKSFF